MVAFLVQALLLVGICYIVVKWIVIPYATYRKYRQYGKGEYHLLMGELSIFLRSFKLHKDMEYHDKHLMDDDQDQKVYVVNVGTSTKLRLVAPDILKEFYMKQEFYEKSELLIDNLQRFISEGIVAAKGETWKKSRRIFSKAFHYDYLQGFSAKIEENANRVFQNLIATNELSNVNTIDVMQQITGSIIILSFFGETLEEERFKGLTIIQALSHSLGSLGNQLMSPFYMLFGKTYFELGVTRSDRELIVFLKEFKAYIRDKFNKKITDIQAEINAHGTTAQQSILAELITSKQIDEVSREQLFDDFLTFYLAGMDTTGHLLGMIVYYLTQHKDIFDRLKKEIDENVDQSAAGLAHLPFLNAVIKETLRFYGPANFLFDRIALKDHELGGIPIKKGMLVNPHMLSIHRNAKYFENPHVYYPSRWLTQTAKEIPNYAYVPFSAGARNCIGQHLATLESRIILNIFIKTFEFSSPEDYQLKMGYTFLPEPTEPLRILLVPRQDGSSITKQQ